MKRLVSEPYYALAVMGRSIGDAVESDREVGLLHEVSLAPGPRELSIAIFAESYPQVSETFVLRHIEGLRDAGHQVTVFPTEHLVGHHPVSTGPTVDVQAFRPVPTRRAHRLLRLVTDLVRSALKHPVSLGRLLIDEARFGHEQLPFLLAHLAAIPVREFDVVLGEFGTSSRRAALLVRSGMLQARLVSMFRGSDATVLPSTVSRRYYDPVFMTSSRILVLTSFMAETVHRLGAPRELIERVPNGVDQSLFAARKSQRLTEETRYDFLAVGRLVECKGFHVAIEAIRLLHDRGLPARLTIVGAGPLGGTLEQQIVGAGLEGTVRLLGPLSHVEVARLMRKYSGVVVPGVVAANGQVEAFGNVVVEAQASGTPVIASRVGGIPEASGPSVRLVPPGDPNALAEEMARVASASEEARRAIATVGHSWVRTQFDPIVQIKRLEQVLEDVVSVELDVRRRD